MKDHKRYNIAAPITFKRRPLMSHNTVIKLASAAVFAASLSGAYYIGSKHPAPQPKVIVIEKPVVVEKRVEVPVPAKTPVVTPTTKSTVAK